MRSSYKKIGSFVKQVNVRNKDLSVTNLQGININKFFMPSVANTNGTDLSKYKVVTQKQFAFNPMHVGRDEVLPISMLEAEESVIVSPAYVVFKVKDETQLLPEYLMMWCRRPEFDRNAWFTTDSSVRGGFSWKDFCDLTLPIPSIEKQREIVQEYNIIVERIQLNEQLNQNLEETAQAVYKQWFVDFEFPITKDYAVKIGKPELEGKPYKSSGGKMVWNDDLEKDVPENWGVSTLGDFVKDTLGGDWGKSDSEDNYQARVKCIRGTDIPSMQKGDNSELPVRFILEKNAKSRELKQFDIVIEMSGGSPVQSTGRTCILLKKTDESNRLICSNFCRVIKLIDKKNALYFYGHLQYLYSLGKMFAYENSTTGVKNFGLESFLVLESVVQPPLSIILRYSDIVETIIENRSKIAQECLRLSSFSKMLEARLATFMELA